jgi:hypothetical protein
LAYQSSGSTSLSTAQSMVATAIAISAASRAVLWPRSTASTSAVVADRVSDAVLVIEESKHPPPTTPAPKPGLSTGVLVTVG